MAVDRSGRGMTGARHSASAGGRWRVRLLLPNALTTFALLCGFAAILRGANGDFGGAAALLLAAMVFDSMDGRVARKCNAESAFGVQYDSLSDMVSFGIAPALLSYQWGLGMLGPVGASAAFCFCACAALRLARFNIRSGSADKRFFEGLPSPAAAALLVGYVWLLSRQGGSVTLVEAWAGALVAVIGGLLMVSSIPFFSGKVLGKGMQLWAVVLMVALVTGAVLTGSSALSLYLVCVGYGLSGPFFKVVRCRR